jgi:hypothetical protein
MPNKAELEKRVEELEAQLRQPQQLPEQCTIALTFIIPTGQLTTVASSTPSTAAAMGAQKAALTNALNQTDALLLQAVRREAQKGDENVGEL